MKHGYLLFILLFLSTSWGCQKMKLNNLEDSLAPTILQANELAQQTMADGHFPGMVIMVSWKNNFIFSKGYGYSNMEASTPISPEKSLFRVGSVSKTFTAAALGKLLEAGKIELDRPIQSYVPQFPEKEYPITLRLLAGHLAGIRHYRGGEFLSNTYYATVNEGLEIFKNDPLLFKPGTKYAYSSYGWNLISAAIEHSSKEPFLAYMDKVVFKPLKMKHTFPDYAHQDFPDRVSFYELENEQPIIAPTVDNSYKWAGGGFIATAADVVAFAQGHMKPGYLSASTLATWQSSQKTTTGKVTNYGIGWRQGKTPNGHQWHGHSGGSVGGTSMMAIYPDKELVVVTLVNLSSAKMDNLAHKVADLFIASLPD